MERVVSRDLLGDLARAQRGSVVAANEFLASRPYFDALQICWNIACSHEDCRGEERGEERSASGAHTAALLRWFLYLEFKNLKRIVCFFRAEALAGRNFRGLA
jgi:hypothetical protein